MDYLNVSKQTAYERIHSLEDLGLIKNNYLIIHITIYHLIQFIYSKCLYLNLISLFI
jgi:DNA-binding Lrp family transcriptional regulator